MEHITNKKWTELKASARKIVIKKLGNTVADVLLAYQKELMVNTAFHEVVVIEKSRRTGITWAAAADAVLHGAAAASANGMDVFYIGYNLEMAREFIDVCAMWARSFLDLAADVEEFIFTDLPNNDDGSKDVKAFRIRFASGFEIVALPSSPRALRGKQGYVIIDEAAFHDNLDELLKAAFALLMWGGKVLVISTHDGVDNAFNDLVTSIRGEKKPYKLMRLTFDKALQDGLYERICLVKGKEAYSETGEAEWRDKIYSFYGDGASEELDVEPSAGSGTWISTSVISGRSKDGVPVIRLSKTDAFTLVAEKDRKVEIDDWIKEYIKALLDDLDKGLRYGVGIDFARSSDKTAIWVSQKQQNTKLKTKLVIELHKMPFAQQRQIMFYIINKLPQLTGIAVDAHGIGMETSEAIADKFGRHRVFEIHASEDWYRTNMPPLKEAFEDDEFDIPKDTDIQADFRQVKLIGSTPRLPKSRTTGTDGNNRHADTVIAAVFALFATKQEVTEFDYKAVPRASKETTDKPAYRSRARFGRNKREGVF